MKDKSINHPFYLQIQRDIDRVEKKSDKYRNAFYTIRIGLIIIASAITIASGWKPDPDPVSSWIFNLLLVLGALTTAITALDTLFQVETKKNTYKLMLVELREIRSEAVFYHNKKDEKALQSRIDEHLFPKYQIIMAYSKSLIEKENESKETVPGNG